tara:strand:- start:189 stop:317 length:129 start_codon:yes stop_codon:yes gene_type:complete
MPAAKLGIFSASFAVSVKIITLKSNGTVIILAAKQHESESKS